MENKRKAKTEELKFEPPKPEDLPPLLEPEVPTFILVDEFLYSIRGNYMIETIGGFVQWIRQKSVPKKLPLSSWKSLFDEYSNRKV